MAAATARPCSERLKDSASLRRLCCIIDHSASRAREGEPFPSITVESIVSHGYWQLCRGEIAEARLILVTGDRTHFGKFYGRLIAGILLLIPGFLTDIVGLALFLPPVRAFLWNRLMRNVVVVDISGMRPGGRPETAPDRTIDLDDGDFRRDDRP